MATTEDEDRITFRVENDEANRPAVDQLGRRNLHKIGLTTWVRFGFMQLGMPFEKIPGDFWSQDADTDGYTIAFVACPCKHTPVVDAGAWATCECERAYAFTGTDVYVINSQRPREPEPPAPS